MPSTNQNLEALIALLDERTASTNTLLQSVVDRQDYTNTILADTLAATIEVRELSNSMLYQLTLVQEWDLNALITSKFNSMYELVGLIDNNTQQLKDVWLNFGFPMLENIFYAVNQNNSAAYASTTCFDCDRPALLPDATSTTPTSGSLHCQRVQYYVATIRDSLSGFINRFTSGITLTTTAAEILLLAGVVPGVDVASIPLGLITAVISFGGTLWREKLVVILDALTDHYQELITALNEAPDSGNASSAWYSWTDTYIPAESNREANLLCKLWGTFIFMNVLYDQTVDWDVDGYDSSACEIDSGLYTPLNSRPGIQLHLNTIDGSASQVEDERPWREITASIGVGMLNVDDLFCSDITGFTEDMQMNDAPTYAGYWEEQPTNLRMRVNSSDGVVNLQNGDSVIVTLGTFYTELESFDLVDARIVGEIGAGPFVLHVQRFYLGEWTSLY